MRIGNLQRLEDAAQQPSSPHLPWSALKATSGLSSCRVETIGLALDVDGLHLETRTLECRRTGLAG